MVQFSILFFKFHILNCKTLVSAKQSNWLQVQVDKGAIKFVLSGAHIMCPGLTSPGADLPVELPTDTPVSIIYQTMFGSCHEVEFNENS